MYMYLPGVCVCVHVHVRACVCVCMCMCVCVCVCVCVEVCTCTLPACKHAQTIYYLDWCGQVSWPQYKTIPHNISEEEHRSWSRSWLLTTTHICLGWISSIRWWATTASYTRPSSGDARCSFGSWRWQQLTPTSFTRCLQRSEESDPWATWRSGGRWFYHCQSQSGAVWSPELVLVPELLATWRDCAKYLTTWRREERGRTVWHAVTEKKAVPGICLCTSVIPAPTNHPCALLAAFKPTTRSSNTDGTSSWYIFILFVHAPR